MNVLGTFSAVLLSLLVPIKFQKLKEHRLWLLVSLKLSGEAAVEELRELDVLIQQNPDLIQQLEVLEALWKKMNETSVEKVEGAFEKHLLRFNGQFDEIAAEQESKEGRLSLAEGVEAQPAKKYKRIWWLGGIAASIISFWVFLNITDNNENRLPKSVANTVSTKAGYKASINLPDGSKVWLNGDSKIVYDGDFQGETREVYLAGEAFFDVAKDKTRPFIIHTRTINLKVLGTAFNVRSYATDKETETSLVHGSVEVTLKDNPDKKIILKPGEKLLVKNSPNVALHKSTEHGDEDEPIAVLAKMHYYGNDSSAVETSWTKNKLVFNNERFDKIALSLERWFNLKVIIKDSDLKMNKYTFTVEEEDKLEEVLLALKVTEGFRYSIDRKEVTIRR